jgi:hypothetical protein
MKAFRVFVNGEQVCTAGIGPDGVLTTLLDWVGGSKDEGLFSFLVGGLDSRTDEHIRWQVPKVTVGDEVSIFIIDSNEIDPELKRSKNSRSGATSFLAGSSIVEVPIRRKERLSGFGGLMKAFHVCFNGEQVCTAGIGPDGVLCAAVNWRGRANEEGQFCFQVGGLDSRTNEHANWEVPQPKVGDEFSILIVETDAVDPEQERYKRQWTGQSRDGHSSPGDVH